jgi:hypothetical protein
MVEAFTDATEWAEAAYSTLLQSCLTQVEFDMEVWVTVNGTNGTTSVEPPYTIFDALLCAGNCSNNGDCVDGMA